MLNQTLDLERVTLEETLLGYRTKPVERSMTLLLDRGHRFVRALSVSTVARDLKGVEG